MVGEKSEHVLTPRGAFLAAADLYQTLEDRVSKLERTVEDLCAGAHGHLAYPPADEEAPPEDYPIEDEEDYLEEDQREGELAPTLELVSPQSAVTQNWEVVAGADLFRASVHVRFGVDADVEELSADRSHRLLSIRSEYRPPLFLRIERNRVYATAGSGYVEVERSILPGLEYDLKLEIDARLGKVHLAVWRAVDARISSCIVSHARRPLLTKGSRRLYEVVAGDALFPALKVDFAKIMLS